MQIHRIQEQVVARNVRIEEKKTYDSNNQHCIKR